MQFNALKNMVILGAIASFLAVGVVPAQAVPIKVDFTATNFTPSGAPTDPVTGTIIYDSASPTANVNSLTSINLTIGTFTYSTSDVGFVSPDNIGGVDYQLIGGTANGVGLIVNMTNDFAILWNQTTLAPLRFVYTTTMPFGPIWDTERFSNFTVTELTSPVPEPASMLLLGSGLLGLWGFREKFQK